LDNKINDNDNELIHKIQDGDTNAFRTLVDLYKDKSLSLALSIVKNESLAEDILQDSFITVYKNIKGFKFKSKFSTWLYKIIVNTSYNELKRQKRNISIEESDFVTNLSSEQKENLVLSFEDQKIYIQKAMEQLKTDEALVLRLFYLCEMSLKEITAITKFSASKVRVDIHRGKKNIKYQLKQLLGEEINHLL
jgi:RNA polymerase sigma factor (sigma-70 family)